MKEQQKQHQLEAVEFHGDTLYVVEHDNEPYVPLRPIVEGMGLDWSAQSRRLHRNKDRWATVAIMATVGDGKQRSTLSMPLRKLTGFLADIDASRVKKDLRAKIVVYQNECDDVLHRYFTTGHAANPRHQAKLPPPSQPLPLLAELAEQFQHTALALNSPELTDQQRWDLASRITSALFGDEAAYLLGEKEVKGYRARLDAILVRNKNAPPVDLPLLILGAHGLEITRPLLDYFCQGCCRVKAGQASSEDALYRKFSSWFRRAFDHEPPHMELFREAMAKRFRRISLAGQPWYLGLTLLDPAGETGMEVVA